jgi:hypothetical protein
MNFQGLPNPRQNSMKRTYAEIHIAHQGKSSDKWASYLQTYERLFGVFRDARINIVEIGVQNGGFLEVLAQYFPNAANIIGCDINPLCGNLEFEDARISVIVGDVSSPEVYSRIAIQAKPIDLIIDDGSHNSPDVIAAFINYFPLVRQGGLYVIEDTHTLYWEKWHGGVLRESSAQQLFKLLTDVINYEHWNGDLPLNTLLSSFFRKDAVPKFITEGWVNGLEFLNSMIVIHNAKQATHSKLGARTVVGTEFSVDRASECFKAEAIKV